MADRDSRNIARRWNREIDDEIRRTAILQAQRGRWRVVVWTVLWLLWLGVIVAIVAHIRS